VFSGVFESPNHQFKLEVTDAGILLKGPTSKINLTNGGVEVQSFGLDGVKVKTGAVVLSVEQGTVSLQASGAVQINGGQVQLNGCLPVARVGDLVTSGPIGQIITGSPTVCAG
jgi:hypothetical protein